MEHLRSSVSRMFIGLACLGLGAGCATGSKSAPAAQPAAGATAAAAPSGTEDKLRAVLAMPHRTEANRQRDQYRHPVETLSFFGIRDDMSVVELWPGGGWYTEVL